MAKTAADPTTVAATDVLPTETHLKPLAWAAIAGGTVTSLLLIARKAKAQTSAQPPPPPGAGFDPTKTYGETTRVALAVPAGWRRVTGADIAATPDLVGHANALINTPGFTSMQYGTLAPFVASDGKTYATWVEQHFHPPGGPVKPWGYHHGATLLAQAGAPGVLGLSPPAATDLGAATVYDFTYVWDGRAWQVEKADFVIEADILYNDRLEGKPYSDLLKRAPPPYRVVVRYYIAEQNGNRFWKYLGTDKNYY